MEENMSISVNGQPQVPPGFRFHPTEEELLYYYLRKKVSYEKIDLDVIRDVDLNKLEPWDIQEKCKIGTTPQNDWYFFSHKDKKYPTGTRTNRATAAGFWKATGRDKVIYSNCRRIGMRKTLVFYKGRAPHGQKSDWIMHEYRLDDNITDTNIKVTNPMGEAAQEEGWVVCRIFQKKNLHKTLSSPVSSSINAEIRGVQMFNSSINEEASLEQILDQYMGRSSLKEENYEANHSTLMINNGAYDEFTKLPSLESPNSTSSQNCYHHMIPENNEDSITNNQVHGSNHHHHMAPSLMITNWSALDRLVASQLNGQTETSRQLSCFNDPTMAAYCNPTDDNHDDNLQLPTLRSSSTRSYHGAAIQDYNSEIDLWNFARSSSSDPLFHVSNTSVQQNK